MWNVGYSLFNIVCLLPAYIQLQTYRGQESSFTLNTNGV